jgi:putative hydrolase of the HAD superfamily
MITAAHGHKQASGGLRQIIRKRTRRMRADIRAVLLDGDGVVQVPEASWIGDIQALCGDASRADAFLRDVFEAERPALLGQADFRPNLQQVLLKWGAAAPVDEALRVWHKIQPDADALDLVRELRADGLIVGLASNQQRYRASYMEEKLAYRTLFNQLLFSCDLGSAKPDRQYFDKALQRLAVRSDQALFIDDHLANVEAARHCGIHAEVFHLREGVARLRAILVAWGLLSDRAAGRLT